MAIESIPGTTLNMALAASAETRASSRSAPTSELAANALVAPLAESKPAEKPPASEDQLKDAIKAANDFVQPINNAVEFSLDKESDKMIVKVVDTATKEVIRQFPSEEMLALAQALDKIQGLLIKQKA